MPQQLLEIFWLFFSLWLQKDFRQRQTTSSCPSQWPIFCSRFFFFPFAYFCDTMFVCDDSLRGILSWQFAIISISNLCGMATDRYVAIVRPFKYVKFMISRTFLLVIVSAWVLPLLLYLPPSLYMHFAGASKALNFSSKSSMASCLK